MSDPIASIAFFVPRILLAQAVPATDLERPGAPLDLPPVQPIESPPPPPPVDRIIALIQLKDSSVITLNESQATAGESRVDFLENKYRLFRETLTAQKDSIENIEVKDPAVFALWNLDNIISQPLEDESIVQLNNFLAAGQAGSDRDYLRLIITQRLHAAGRLDEAKAKAELQNLTREHPTELVFQEALCQHYLVTGRFDLAASHFITFLTRLIPLSTEEAKAKDLSLVQALLRHASSPGQVSLLHKLGDYLKIWSEQENDPTRSKNLILAAEACYLKALSLDRSEEAQFIGYLKLADVQLQLVKLEKEEEAAEERFDKAIGYFADLLRLAPDHPPILLKAGDLYLAKAGNSGDEAALKQAREFYEKAFALAAPPNKEIYLRLTAVYQQQGDFEQAVKNIKSALALDSNDPMLYALLGDVYYNSGQIKLSVHGEQLGDYTKLTQCLEAYKTALAKARALNSPILLAAIHQRMSNLRIQVRMEQAAKFSGNIFKVLLRMTGDLLYFANPVNMIATVVRPPKTPKHTRDELGKFAAELARLEESAWQASSDQETGVEFYLLNLSEFTKLSAAFAEQIKATDKQLVSPDLVDGLKAAKAWVERKISQCLDKLAALAENETVWEQALEKKDAKAVVNLLKETFQNYLALSAYLKAEKLPARIKEKLADVLDDLWEQLEDRVDEALEWAEDEQAAEVAFAALTFLAQAGATVKDKAKELDELVADGFKAQIAIAGEKKDFKSLLELAKNKNLGVFSFKALERAIEVAKEKKTAGELMQAGELAVSLSVGAEEKSAQLSAAFLELAARAYRSAAEVATDREGKVAAAINLWRIGRHKESIGIFEALIKEIDDQEGKIRLLADLAYMQLALGRQKEALALFKQARAWEEIRYLRRQAFPPDIAVEGNGEVSIAQLRAVSILYSHWLAEPDLATVSQGLREFYAARGLKIDVVAKHAPGQPPAFQIKTKQIAQIEIEGLDKTKKEVVLRELAFAGLNEGGAYNKKAIADALPVAQNRLQTFTLNDWRVEEKEGKLALIVSVDEERPEYFFIGGGGGNLEANVYGDAGYGNLFGGGEKIGAKINHHWFYGNGYRSFSLWEGSLYYKDPHLLAWKGKPVSFGIAAERYGRLDYTSGEKEVVTGGSATFGLHFTPRTAVYLTPSTYQVASTDSYYRQGFKIQLAHDHRDNWLFPSAGYYLSGYTEPGVYFGTNRGSVGFVTVGAEARRYFVLPADFSVMLGGKGAYGFNLLGGDQFFLGNGFVRSNNSLANYGPAVLGVSLELKSPVFNLEYLKAQPYLFTDAGCAFRSTSRARCGVGVGAGTRVLLLGMIFNLYFGLPDGFGFRIAPPGQD